MGGTKWQIRESKIISISAIVVNDGGQCSGTLRQEGRNMDSAQLCHKYMIGRWAQNQASFFFYGIFHIFHFNSSGACLEQVLTNYGQIWLSPVFVNKALLGHGHTHLLHMVCGCC